MSMVAEYVSSALTSSIGREPGCVRLILADDEEMSRRGLGAVLQDAGDIKIVGQGRIGEEVLQLVLVHQPDVLLLNAATDGDWVAMVREIEDELDDTSISRVIVVTEVASDEDLVLVIRAGAAGILQRRNLSADELLYAIRQVALGNCVLSPVVTASLIRRFRESGLQAPDPALAGLSRREQDVLAGLAAGRSNLEIAVDIHLTVATVKSHVSSILTKLEVRDRVQAALLGQRAALGFDPPSRQHRA
jgi:DNA-binding NarL/FixJ family response regulator